MYFQGQCDSVVRYCDPTQTHLKQLLNDYAEYFPMRYVIGIGGKGECTSREILLPSRLFSERCDFNKLEPFWQGSTDNCEVCGGVMNVLGTNGMSYNSSGAALPASFSQLATTIKRALAKQPGCG